MGKNFEARVVKLETARPPRPDGAALARRIVRIEKRINKLPAEQRDRAWHNALLDFTTAELGAIIEHCDGAEADKQSPE